MRQEGEVADARRVGQDHRHGRRVDRDGERETIASARCTRFVDRLEQAVEMRGVLAGPAKYCHRVQPLRAAECMLAARLKSARGQNRSA